MILKSMMTRNKDNEEDDDDDDCIPAKTTKKHYKCHDYTTTFRQSFDCVLLSAETTFDWQLIWISEIAMFWDSFLFQITRLLCSQCWWICFAEVSNLILYHRKILHAHICCMLLFL